MANLIVQKTTAGYQVWDVDQGVAVFAAENESVANAYAANGQVTTAAFNLYRQQDINYQGGIDTSPAAVPGSNPDNPVPAQINTNNGVSYTSSTSLTADQQQALLNRLNQNPAPTGTVSDPLYSSGTRALTTDEINGRTNNAVSATTYNSTATTESVNPVTQSEGVDISEFDPNFGRPSASGIARNATPVPGNLIYQYPSSPTGGTPYDDDGNLMPGWSLDEGNNPVWVGDNFVEPATAALAEQSRIEAFKLQAQQQQTISQQRRQVNNGDWRVRLQLAPGSKYLYNDPSPGILAPLTITDGVIFPYTPKIDTVYRANYETYDLTHSNYRGYFYKGSAVDAINMSCVFTAQDTDEANYLLAVITFFKSVTKMFYGQDAERGAPPPLVFLSGLGQYQFNEHPCVVQSFNFNLPSDVDYIRAGSTSMVGTNLTTNRDRQSVATNGVFSSLNRLAAAFLPKGAIPSILPPGLLQLNSPTYVPTKIEISLSLLPVQSRQQVSKQFSLKNFANGNLIKGGFW